MKINFKILRTLSLLSIFTVLLFVKINTEKGIIVPYWWILIDLIYSGHGWKSVVLKEFIICLSPLLTLLPLAKKNSGIWIGIPILISFVYLANNINSRIHINFLSIIPFWLIWSYIIYKRTR